MNLSKIMKPKPILTNYLKSITTIASQGDAREESFYSCLETLLEQLLYPETGTQIVEV